MRRKLVEILKELEASIPVPSGFHHVLMFTFYDAEPGMDALLAMQVNTEGGFVTLCINEGDLEKSAQEIVRRIPCGIDKRKGRSPNAELVGAKK